MLLVLDVGNTNITGGVYYEDNLIKTFRAVTTIERTSDEFGILLMSLLNNNAIDHKTIDGVIIASVVPNLMYSLTSAVTKYFNVKPLVVGPGIKTGIKIDTPNPKEIGPDRIVDIVAAYEKYGGPTLVLDFGTATTYDLVLEDGRFTVGITAPGIKISAKALWEKKQSVMQRKKQSVKLKKKQSEKLRRK